MTLKIVVLNPKGGSGKTTVATNLAAFYAQRGQFPALRDLDAQASSTRWLAKRAEDAPRIHGVSPFNVPAKLTRTFAMRIPPEVVRIVVDTPAAIGKHQFIEFTRDADRILIPVLPSDIDIQAVTRCIADLLLHAKISRGENRIAVVANRVKPNTLIFRSLMRFLGSLKIPVVAALRDSQNYIRAAESGIGLHEMTGSRSSVDQAHWAPMIDWIEHGTIPTEESRSANTQTADDADSTAEAASEPPVESISPLRMLNVSAFIERKSQ